MVGLLHGSLWLQVPCQLTARLVTIQAAAEPERLRISAFMVTAASTPTGWTGTGLRTCIIRGQAGRSKADSQSMCA